MLWHCHMLVDLSIQATVENLPDIKEQNESVS